MYMVVYMHDAELRRRRVLGAESASKDKDVPPGPVVSSIGMGWGGGDCRVASCMLHIALHIGM